MTCPQCRRPIRDTNAQTRLSGSGIPQVMTRQQGATTYCACKSPAVPPKQNKVLTLRR